MKKITLLISCTALLACNKNENKENSQQSNSAVIWAATVQTNLPMEQDSMWSKEEWDKAYKFDKAKIFNTVKSAVLEGKMKVYSWYPDAEMSIEEFNAILISWDSMHQAEDINNPGVMISSPIKNVLTADDIAEIRFNESIEFDTLSCTLQKKVSVAQFVGLKKNEVGEVLGFKKLFDVKFNDGSPSEIKK